MSLFLLSTYLGLGLLGDMTKFYFILFYFHLGFFFVCVVTKSFKYSVSFNSHQQPFVKVLFSVPL